MRFSLRWLLPALTVLIVASVAGSAVRAVSPAPTVVARYGGGLVRVDAGFPRNLTLAFTANAVAHFVSGDRPITLLTGATNIAAGSVSVPPGEPAGTVTVDVVINDGTGPLTYPRPVAVLAPNLSAQARASRGVVQVDASLRNVDDALPVTVTAVVHFVKGDQFITLVRTAARTTWRGAAIALIDEPRGSGSVDVTFTIGSYVKTLTISAAMSAPSLFGVARASLGRLNFDAGMLVVVPSSNMRVSVVAHFATGDQSLNLAPSAATRRYTGSMVLPLNEPTGNITVDFRYVGGLSVVTNTATVPVIAIKTSKVVSLVAGRVFLYGAYAGIDPTQPVTVQAVIHWSTGDQLIAFTRDGRLGLTFRYWVSPPTGQGSGVVPIDLNFVYAGRTVTIAASVTLP